MYYYQKLESVHRLLVSACPMVDDNVSSASKQIASSNLFALLKEEEIRRSYDVVLHFTKKIQPAIVNF